VDSVLLKPLGFHESSRLMACWERVRFLRDDATGPNPRHADIWQKRMTSLSGMALVRHGAGGLTLGTEHPQLIGTVTSYVNLFDVLQVTPLLGRTFLPEDGVEGRDRVAVLTYALWQSVFQGDPDVVGKTIRLAGTPREVIGVLPPTFISEQECAARLSLKQPAALCPSQPFLSRGSTQSVQLERRVRQPGWQSPASRMSQYPPARHQLTTVKPTGARNAGPNRMTSRMPCFFLQPMREAVVGESEPACGFS
jgi:hypothetical protein